MDCGYRLIVFSALCVAIAGCGSSESNPGGVDAAGQAANDAGMTNPDAAGPDAGPCTPGAESLVCDDSRTLSLCTDDYDFDRQSDGPAKTIAITCEDFVRGVHAASCETFDANTTEALCTMDDGGPCGVILVTGQVASLRCTSDDAVCLLNLDVENYVCTTGTGISCSATGDDFVPFCRGDLLVWQCIDDGDGTFQPRVDDCKALGNGTCNATESKCTDIEEGGRCNTTEWFCAAGLSCRSDVCVRG